MHSLHQAWSTKYRLISEQKNEDISGLQEVSHINNTFVLILMFTFHIFWDSLGTSILRNSISAANNIQTRIPSRLSFRLLWLWYFNWDSTQVDKVSFPKTPILKLPSLFHTEIRIPLLWPRKFYTRRDKIKVNSIETEWIVTAHLLPSEINRIEMQHHTFLIIGDKTVSLVLCL